MVVLVGMIGFHRIRFLEVLATHVDQHCVTTHFSKRLVSYNDVDGPNSPVQLMFADGSSATADILIGCDGIHSTVRHQLLESAAARCESTGVQEDLTTAEKLRASIEPVWTGSTVYRSVISSEMLAEKCPNALSLSRPIYVSASPCLYLRCLV